MAEYLIQSEDLVAIADKIRVLSGTTEAMGLDDMESYVGEANSEINSQVQLLTQAVAALEGKANNKTIKTCNLTVSSRSMDSINYHPVNIAYITVNESGNIIFANETVSGNKVTVTCLQNSIVAVKFKNNFNLTSSSTSSTHCLFYDESLAVFKIETEDSLTIINSEMNSGGSND